jgi:hypothetical protein
MSPQPPLNPSLPRFRVLPALHMSLRGGMDVLFHANDPAPAVLGRRAIPNKLNGKTTQLSNHLDKVSDLVKVSTWRNQHLGSKELTLTRSETLSRYVSSRSLLMGTACLPFPLGTAQRSEARGEGPGVRS